MDSSSGRKSVCIIGAGPSGLVSAKEALQNHLDFLILEKCGGLGGLWNPATGGVWASMHTNLSKFSCSFIDFPWEDQDPMFPSSGEIYSYLSAYAAKFSLAPNIRFNSTVTRVEQKGSGWLVHWTDTATGGVKSREFEGLIVATGIFAEPYIPALAGLETFSGTVVHSKEFRDRAPFTGQTVLVVGGSMSGVEVAAELSGVAKEVIHSYRNPFWVLNRYLPDGRTGSLPIDLLFYNRKSYAQAQEPSQTFSQRMLKKNGYLSQLCAEQQTVEGLRIPETEFSSSIFTTISDTYVEAVNDKKIIPVRGEISALNGSRAILLGNKAEFQVDAIILATGFKVRVPFLSSSILETIGFDERDQIQPLILYKATLHPELPNLFFVGMYKGPYFGVMELQARWACRLLAGRVSLPPEPDIRTGLEEEMRIRNRELGRVQFPHPDYVGFADELGVLSRSFGEAKSIDGIGETDFFKDARRDPVHRMFMTGPVIPQHYDLFENPDRAIEQMQKVVEICGAESQ